MKTVLICIFCVICLQSAHADNQKRERLGCGTLVSIRPVNQKPFQNIRNSQVVELRLPGATVIQILSNVPGASMVGTVAAAVVSDSIATSVVESANREAEAQQEATQNYKGVFAVEFKFDDGRTVKLPMMVVSGMRYKPGVRLYAYRNVTLNGILQVGENALFMGLPDVGDSNYAARCSSQVALEEADATIAAFADRVDESKIIAASD
jgi:hypothetical protein